MSIGLGVGLISGMNYESMISQITALNQRPINNLALRQSQYQQKISAYNAINSRLIQLDSALQRLSDPDDFQSASANSSQESALTAAAADSAAAGVYSIDVTQLAQSERRAAQGVEATDTVIADAGGGQFSFRIGADGARQSIDVDADMTLAELRDAINDADMGVTANIVNDGSDDTPYRLTLTVDVTGADNTIQFIDNDTTLDFEKTVRDAEADAGNSYAGTATSSGTYTGTGAKDFLVKVVTSGAVGVAEFQVSTDGGETWSDSLTSSETATDIGDGVQISFSAADDLAVDDQFTIEAFDPFLRQAQDAALEVDGIAVTRSTNSVSGVIDGVTINLADVTEETAQLTVSVDKTTAKSTIRDFVNAYNSLVQEIDRQTAYDAENDVASPLMGDSTVRSIRSSVTNLVTGRIPGMSADRLNSLGQAGVSLNRNGQLEIDSARLDEALASNYEDVVALFATTGTTENANLSFVSASDTGLTGGNFEVNVTRAAARAEVSGANVIDPGGLAADETITFTHNDSNINIALSAGDTLADIIEEINSRLEDEGIDAVAYDDDGKLGLRSEAYGEDAEFTVKSSLDGAGQTGLDTESTTYTGVDVAGTINGRYATGSGQILTGGSGTGVDGLQIQVLSETTGAMGAIEVTFGLSELVSRQVEGITDSTDGLIKTRTDGLNASIEALNERIERMETRVENEAERLRAQFTALEATLADMQSQSQFLSTQLASIASISL